MNEPIKIVFSVDEIAIKEEIENSQFVRARAKVFASGPNLHGMPVLESALKDAEDSIYDKPLIWEYSKVTDDALDHTKNQTPCGFVPRTGANPTYEKAEDGRLFFVVDILIWRRYSGKLLDVFKKTDGEKSVSVEIAVWGTEEVDGVESISKYSYLAITILGERYTSAVPGADITLQQFSVDKSEVEEILHCTFSNNPSEKEGEIVDFNKAEYATQFSMTANQMRDMLQNACRTKKFTREGSDYECTCYWLEDYDNAYVFAYDNKNDGYAALPYSIAEGKVVMDFESAKPAISYRKWEIVEEVAEPLKLREFAKELLTIEFAQKEQEVVELKEQVNIIESQKLEFSTKTSEYEQKIAELQTNNVQLLEFKANVEKEAKLRDMEFALNSVSEDLDKQQTEDWRERMKDFDSSIDYSNQIKAFAYENSRGKQHGKPQVLRAALPGNKDEQKQNTSLWQKY